ncbi:ABC transporter permease subunit [Nonomuraea phyllanthi]|uniref:ABC transporter permease subunit n=1 Tax=Nonomuraea phyllanthi TaxID=2219224 RepID=A0A5C4VCW2_9ACTN|nr:ABC transporter permease [Nonomuraea phyllanthi]KAB8188392.1 ABC transporter permease subunit [Nonomuraea phyllanthi]
MGEVAMNGTTSAWRRWPVIASMVILAVYLMLALAGTFLGDQANVADVTRTLRPPSAEHLLGTDGEGRDVLSRVSVGAGISIMLAAISVALGAAGGLIVALACGLGARWLDRVLMAPMNAVLAFPQLLLAMAIAIALGSGLTSAVIGIVVTIIPVFAVTLRGEALRSRSEAFVEAATTIGLPRWRIALRHVVPYLGTTMTVQIAANFGSAVITLAALSYVGVGARPPTAEWGAMINDGLQHAVSGQWWVGVAPGIALLGLVIAVNIFTDQVRARRRPAGW